jgi:uncharacterized surface protein with fasciclin (FAS1) repeats
LGVVLLLATSVAAAGWNSKSGYYRCVKQPLQHFDGTIAEAAVATPELSTLVFALQEAGLVDALDGDGDLTVYAPTNDAFANVPEDILDALLADPEGLLTAVLTYHVTPGLKDPRRTLRARVVPTLLGQDVFYNRDQSGPRVNQSNVQCTGVRTSNGIVWIIDSVLLPQF